MMTSSSRTIAPIIAPRESPMLLTFRGLPRGRWTSISSTSARPSPITAIEATELDPGTRASDPGRALTQKELVQKVGEAVAGLPHALRAAVVLRILEGRDYEDVARATGLKPGTVRTQVMKARRLLMRALGPWIERNEP